jgi:undecaprenyl-diphosphatase
VLLVRPQPPSDLRSLASLVLGGVIAVVLLGAAATSSATVAQLDGGAVGRLHAWAAQPLTDWNLAVTELGGNHAIVLVTIVGVAGLALAHQWRGALALAVSVPLAQLTVHLVKELVSRPRPPARDALADAPGFSFPSGHASASVALYALLALLAARTCRGPARTAVIACGAVLVLALGTSRVYLGAHYPTDVLAGWLTGATVALLSWAVASRVRAGGVPSPT